jgi:hypothetical protein
MRLVIFYERAEDGATCSVTPARRARLVRTKEGILPLHEVDRKIDPADPSIPYAETMREYVERIMEKDVPKGSLNVRIEEVE